MLHFNFTSLLAVHLYMFVGSLTKLLHHVGVGTFLNVGRNDRQSYSGVHSLPLCGCCAVVHWLGCWVWLQRRGWWRLNLGLACEAQTWWSLYRRISTGCSGTKKRDTCVSQTKRWLRSPHGDCRTGIREEVLITEVLIFKLLRWFDTSQQCYLGGHHSRLWDQVLVDAGAWNGNFVAIDGQDAGSGEPSREGCAGVLLGNLLNDQHFGHHLFATRGIFWNTKMRKCYKVEDEMLNRAEIF